jgi:hypothetical protein
MSTTSAPISSSAELSQANVGQWGSVLAGVLGGFAATIFMTTLGAALGLTVGAATVDEFGADTTTGMAALGFAGVAWLLLTAVVVGITGGIVLARCSRPDRSYHAGTLGLLAWTGGVVLAALVAGPGAVGVLCGRGSGAGGAVAAAAPDGLRRARAEVTEASEPRRDAAIPAEAAAARSALTPAEQQRLRAAAEDAARAAATLAWAALAAQVVSLIATIAAAKWQRQRLVAVEPIDYAVPVR